MPKKLVLFSVNPKFESRNSKPFDSFAQGKQFMVSEVEPFRISDLMLRISLILIGAYLISPAPAYAQGLTREECFQDSIAKLGCLPFYLGNVINGIFALSGIAAIILIIISGIRLLISGGDAMKVSKAKTSLYYSIVGFVIVLASFLILRVISFITGAECINALGFNSCS